MAKKKQAKPKKTIIRKVKAKAATKASSKAKPAVRQGATAGKSVLMIDGKLKKALSGNGSNWRTRAKDILQSHVEKNAQA